MSTGEEFDWDDNGIDTSNASLSRRASLPSLRCGYDRGWQWSPINDKTVWSSNTVLWGYQAGVVTFCNELDGLTVPYAHSASLEVNSIQTTGYGTGMLIGTCLKAIDKIYVIAHCSALTLGSISNDKVKAGYTVASQDCQNYLSRFSGTDKTIPKNPCYGSGNQVSDSPNRKLCNNGRLILDRTPRVDESGQKSWDLSQPSCKEANEEKFHFMGFPSGLALRRGKDCKQKMVTVLRGERVEV